MGYSERYTWAGLVTAAISIAVYLAMVVPQLGSMPVAEVSWAIPMLWTIVGGVVGVVVITTVWATIERVRHPDNRLTEDIRDRDIARLGSRVGQVFLAIDVIAAVVLCALEIEQFWIAQALYAGAALSSVVNCVVRAVAYRRGL